MVSLHSLGDRLNKSRLTRQVLTSSDAETSVEVVDDGKSESLEVERHPVGRDEAHDGDNDDEEGVEPVDMLIPVAPGHGRISNVNFLVPGASTAERLVVGGAIGEGLSLLGLGSGNRRHGWGEVVGEEPKYMASLFGVLQLPGVVEGNQVGFGVD